MYLSISIVNEKMLSTAPSIFLKPPCSAFKIPFWTILLPDKCAGGGVGGGGGIGAIGIDLYEPTSRHGGD